MSWWYTDGDLAYFSWVGWSNYSHFNLNKTNHGNLQPKLFTSPVWSLQCPMECQPRYTSCIQIYTQSWCYGKSSTWTLGLDGLSVRCTQASSDIILALFLHHSATVLSVMTQNNYGKERFDFNLHFFLITDYHWGKVKGGTWRQDFLSLHTALLLNKILSHS